MSQDIPDSRLQARRVSKARLVITAVVVEGRAVARSPPTTACPGPGSTSCWPATGRGRGRIRTAVPATAAPPRATPPTRSTLILAAPQGAQRRGPGRRPRHHRLAPDTTTTPPVSRRNDPPDPGPGRTGHPGAEEATEVVLHPLRGRACPTSAGSPTSPTTALADRTPADVEIITWLDDHSRYALHVTAHHRVTGRDRRWPPSAKPPTARIPRIHADRQRHGLHHPLRRRPRRPQRASKHELADSASSRRTPDPTTRPPAARSVKTWTRRCTGPV